MNIGRFYMDTKAASHTALILFPTLLLGVPERLVIELTSSHDDAEKHSALGAMEANTRDLTLIQRRKLTLVLAFAMHQQSTHVVAQRP